MLWKSKAHPKWKSCHDLRRRKSAIHLIKRIQEMNTLMNKKTLKLAVLHHCMMIRVLPVIMLVIDLFFAIKLIKISYV